MTYRLGIDVGPTHTTWATIADGPKHRPATGHVDNVVGLRGDGSVGAGASVAASPDVMHTVTGFVGKLGQSEPVMVGGTPFGAESLVGHVLAEVLRAARELHGIDPTAVVMVHDDGLDQYRTELLGEAARLAGVPTTNISMASRSETLAVGGGAVGAAALGWQRVPDPAVPGANNAITIAGGAAAGGAVGGAAAAAFGGGSGVAEALGSAAGPAGTPLSVGAAPGSPLAPTGAAPGTPLTPPSGAAPGTPLSTPSGAAPGTPLSPPSGAAPGSPLTPSSPPAPGGSPAAPSGGAPTPSGGGTPDPSGAGSTTPSDPGAATPDPATPDPASTTPDPAAPDTATPDTATPDTGTADTPADAPTDPAPTDSGTPEPGTPEPGSGGGRPPRVDVTRPAIDLVAPVVKTPFPWIKAAAIAALLGVTGGGLAWFFTRGDGESVAPATTVTTTVEATTPLETTGTTAAPTTVAPAVTGVALTTSTAVATTLLATLPNTAPPTAPPVTAAPTVPTTRPTTPTKTVPATTTTVKAPVGVPTTLPTLITFPVILPPVLLNFGPTISNLLVSPASVSSCGQNVNIQVTLTDTDGVSSASATISYIVGGATRTANLKLAPLKGTAWAGQLLINLGDAVNQPASVKITAVDAKGKSANQSFVNRFTVLPCIIG